MIITGIVSLLISLSAVAADLRYYVPQLTNSPIQGRVTTSTFVLDKPQCLFGSTSSNTVWLVVASSTAVVDDQTLATLTPHSLFNTKQYYHTFPNPATFYTCTSTPGYIKVGNDTSCTNIYCNKPLSPGTYKVKFVVLDSADKLIDVTSWSNNIILRDGKDRARIDTWPGRRSGGMIVITTILSILLAAVLVCLVGTFIVGSKNLPCYMQKTERKQIPIPQTADLKNYKTHHTPSNSDLYAQPIA
ncbi:uroplakin-3b-like [Pyxicephalus adspersus]|uniref:uroplakin-3b-like n=1 Tax=Pyxicephalus adspersus TaxID=30357 RepID=UPI003B5B7DA7